MWDIHVSKVLVSVYHSFGRHVVQTGLFDQTRKYYCWTYRFVSLPAGSSSPRLLVLPSLLLLCGNKNDAQCYQLTSNRFLCSLTNATKSKILQKKVLRIWHFLTQRTPGPRMWHRCCPYPTPLWSNLSLLNKLIYGNTIFACRYTINMNSIFGLYAFDINFWMTDACFRCWT